MTTAATTAILTKLEADARADTVFGIAGHSLPNGNYVECRISDSGVARFKCGLRRSRHAVEGYMDAVAA